MNNLVTADNPSETQIRAALDAAEALEKRKTAEAEVQTRILAERAAHDYALAVEEGKAALCEWEACKDIVDATTRDEQHYKAIYKKAKAEYKAFQTSDRLKSAFKTAKKAHLDAEQKKKEAVDAFALAEERLTKAKADRASKLKVHTRFNSENGRGIEKDWRLRRSKYGMGMPNSPAQQLLRKMDNDAAALEAQRHQAALDAFKSASLLACGDRHRNRVVSSSIDLLQPLTSILIFRPPPQDPNVFEEDDGLSKNQHRIKNIPRIPRWLYTLLPEARVVCCRCRWNLDLFPSSMKTPAREGMQLLARYDNLVESLFGQSHVWLVSSVKRLMHNAIDGGSSGIVCHGHRSSGKTYALFHMGGAVQLVKPKSVILRDLIAAHKAKHTAEDGEGTSRPNSRASRPNTSASTTSVRSIRTAKSVRSGAVSSASSSSSSSSSSSLTSSPPPIPALRQKEYGAAKPKIPRVGHARLCKITPHKHDGLLPRCIDALFDRNASLEKIAPKAEVFIARDDKNAPAPEPHAAQHYYNLEISSCGIYQDEFVDLNIFRRGRETAIPIEIRWNPHLKTHEPAPLKWNLCKTRQEARSVLRHILANHQDWSEELWEQKGRHNGTVKPNNRKPAMERFKCRPQSRRESATLCAWCQRRRNSTRWSVCTVCGEPKRTRGRCTDIAPRQQPGPRVSCFDTALSES